MLTALAYSADNGFYGLGYGYGGFFFDPTYMLVVIGLIITLIASANVKSTFAKYHKVISARRLTGAQA